MEGSALDKGREPFFPCERKEGRVRAERRVGWKLWCWEDEAAFILSEIKQQGFQLRARKGRGVG